MQELTGADFVLLSAERADENGQPFAHLFRMMAQQAALGGGLISTATERVSTRALEPDEASAASIVLNAYEVARQHGDPESVNEVLTWGMALLAKWAEFLAITEQHPRLSFGGVEES